MKNNNKIQLTFEMNKKSETLEIHCNSNGLEFLIEELLEIKKKEHEHCHLMTETFGGDELLINTVGAKNKIINHVKIYNWGKDIYKYKY